MEDVTAAAEWTAQLQAWRIPDHIRAHAPRNPYEFPASVIQQSTVDPLETPTGLRISQRLQPGEPLLDVGCGAGRLSAAFATDHPVTGVEPRSGLAATAQERGLTVIDGRWPDVADTVDHAPVVMCTHVMYDVQQPLAFLHALDRVAGRRVVLEVTSRHPWVDIGPLYRLVHDIGRPDGPTSVLLSDVVAEAVGRPAQATAWTKPGSVYDTFDDLVDHQRRMLCIGPDHPADVRMAAAVRDTVSLTDDGRVRRPDVDMVTLWWDTDG